MRCACRASLSAANLSTAYLYRVIEQDNPTLLVDQIEDFFANPESKSDIIGIFACYKREMKVGRCGGANRDKLEEFETFCFKAFAGTVKMPEQIADRCIRIELRKRPRGKRFLEWRELAWDLHGPASQGKKTGAYFSRGKAPGKPAWRTLRRAHRTRTTASPSTGGRLKARARPCQSVPIASTNMLFVGPKRTARNETLRPAGLRAGPSLACKAACASGFIFSARCGCFA
jgi:hypothetical protein